MTVFKTIVSNGATTVAQDGGRSRIALRKLQMNGVTSILAIVAVVATIIGLALDYASMALYSDREGSLAVSIAGAFVVLLGVVCEYGLHLESSKIGDTMLKIQHDIEASQQNATSEIRK
jgi:hypothetical protein